MDNEFTGIINRGINIILMISIGLISLGATILGSYGICSKNKDSIYISSSVFIIIFILNQILVGFSDEETFLLFFLTLFIFLEIGGGLTFYRSIIKRMKPDKEDIKYINRLINGYIIHLSIVYTTSIIAVVLFYKFNREIPLFLSGKLYETTYGVISSILIVIVGVILLWALLSRRNKTSSSSIE